MPNGDWFAQNAPSGPSAPSAAPSGDWFTANAPNPGTLPAYSQITGISAQPKSTGWLDDIESTLRDAGNDIRYGTGTTILGRAFKAMGTPRTSSGVSEGTGE